MRGHLTRWLLEISPGVFVGHVSARVREELWERILEFAADGRALMVYSTQGEQRLSFKVHGHDWTPVDHDGLMLMRRQTVPDYVQADHEVVDGAVAQQKNPSRSEPSSTVNSETVWKRREKRRKFKRK
ncbi:CRISPR-associated protein Cas2 [Actinopolyspora biskrensis]|uniref:CRISPR-associated protein Cas2 n=1 Tax=Actinopolyspora biskrensis TaxID=1470178 RepID=A0A852YY21_9ACTN|nr:CRISPR-associated protein Cas2 [Actinopolyspora biskrensis]